MRTHQRFEALCDRVRRDPALRLLHAEVGPPVPPGTLDQLEREHGIAMPEEVRAFYLSAAYLRLAWVDTDDEPWCAMTAAQQRTFEARLDTRFEPFEWDTQTPNGVVNIVAPDVLFSDPWPRNPGVDLVAIAGDREVEVGEHTLAGDEFYASLRLFDGFSPYALTAFATALPSWPLVLGTAHHASYGGATQTLEAYLDSVFTNLGAVDDRRRLFS